MPQQAITGEGFLHEAYADFANISDIVGEHALAAEYRKKVTEVAARINRMYRDGKNIYHQNRTCIPPSSPAYKGAICGDEQGTHYLCPECGDSVCNCFGDTSHTIQSMALFMNVPPPDVLKSAQDRCVVIVFLFTTQCKGRVLLTAWQCKGWAPTTAW